MCEIVPGKRGVVSWTKGRKALQCVFRIPLPHKGAGDFPSSVRRSGNGLPKTEGGFFMYPHPFSTDYWRDATRELKDLRKLIFAALMIAMCVVLSRIPSVPLFGGAKITWGFLARSVCALVCGPVLGLLFGFTEDILSFFLTGGGGYPFFPGYTLTTMLGVLIYALFFYRAKLTVRRVFLAKLLTNIQNVVLGSLWSAILYGKAWSVMAVGSFWKNLIMLPFQTLLLVLLIGALLPILRRTGLVDKETPQKITW